jgi:hypothetical protein
MIPNNFIYIGLNFERRIFDKMLYDVDSNDISR